MSWYALTSLAFLIAVNLSVDAAHSHVKSLFNVQGCCEARGLAVANPGHIPGNTP